MLFHDLDTSICLQVRFILGPNIPIRCPGYASSEAVIGLPRDPNKPEEFALACDDIIEFLDVSLDATHENLCQAVSIWPSTSTLELHMNLC